MRLFSEIILISRNLRIDKIDVKTMSLKEEIYMNQHEGNIKHGQETKVCKLTISLYSLKKNS
jgi:hypothetical protein